MKMIDIEGIHRSCRRHTMRPGDRLVDTVIRRLSTHPGRRASEPEGGPSC